MKKASFMSWRICGSAELAACHCQLNADQATGKSMSPARRALRLVDLRLAHIEAVPVIDPCSEKGLK
jgi:hypothetical protein